MNKSRVSIIVPIYKVENYLARCMESLLNQTLQDIEIIMIDDESPDNCPAMCDGYARQDSRVKVIHKKNAGLGFARNSGLEIATGEYVAFVDSDDYVRTTMYEELYTEAKNKDLDVAFCNFYRLDKNGIKKEVNEVTSNEYFSGRENIFRFILNMIGTEPACSVDRKYSMSVWHGIYLNDIIKQNNITFKSEREVVSEDILFQILFLYQCRSIGYLKSCNYYYCENDLSLSHSFRKDRFEKYKILHFELIKALSHLYYQKTQYVYNSVDRLFIGYVRSMCLNYTFKISELRYIIEDEFLASIINRYPYKKLPLKHILFILLVKHKLTMLVLLLGKR